MEDRLKNVPVTAGFVVKHQLIKGALGMAAGLLVSALYNKTVLRKELETLYEAQK